MTELLIAGAEKIHPWVSPYMTLSLPSQCSSNRHQWSVFYRLIHYLIIDMPFWKSLSQFDMPLKCLLLDYSCSSFRLQFFVRLWHWEEVICWSSHNSASCWEFDHWRQNFWWYVSLKHFCKNTRLSCWRTLHLPEVVQCSFAIVWSGLVFSDRYKTGFAHVNETCVRSLHWR
jgi:hypothetical protein